MANNYDIARAWADGSDHRRSNGRVSNEGGTLKRIRWNRDDDELLGCRKVFESEVIVFLLNPYIEKAGFYSYAKLVHRAAFHMGKPKYVRYISTNLWDGVVSEATLEAASTKQTMLNDERREEHRQWRNLLARQSRNKSIRGAREWLNDKFNCDAFYDVPGPAVRMLSLWACKHPPSSWRGFRTGYYPDNDKVRYLWAMVSETPELLRKTRDLKAIIAAYDVLTR